MRRSFAGLWRQPEFLKLWTGQTISHLGSHVGGGALRFTAILVLGATPLQLSLLSAAALAPTLLLSLFAGVWVDRLRRRPILIAADLGRALLLLSIPLAFALGRLQIAQLYLVAAATGALTIWFDVAYQAFLPAVVTREQLVEGNSKLGVSDSVAEIAGPPLGGALVQLLSAPFVVLVDALSFVLSATALWTMRTVEPRAAASAEQPQIRREIAAGLHAIVRDPLLRSLLGAAIIFNLFGNIIGALYDLYLLRTLGLTPAMVGITVGVGGIGALLGAFVAQPVVERFGVGPALIGAAALSNAISYLLVLVDGPPLVAFAVIMLMQLADVCIAVFMIGEISLRQSVTPDALLGRVNASFSLLTTAAALVGTLAAGLLAGWLGLRGGIAVGVAGGTLMTLWLALGPLRTLHAPPTPAALTDPR